MISKIIKINSPVGMHARPAGELSKLVKSLSPAKISLATEAKTVNAASIISVLSLGLKSGSEIKLLVEAPENEEQILSQVADFIENIKD